MKNENKVKNESGIYKIKNLINNKVYIGSTIHLLRRSYEHAVRLRTGDDCVNKYLQRAWNKYGEHNFIFIVLEYCEKEKLLEKEQYWMDLYCSYEEEYGYNLRIKAESNRGYRHSEEVKEQIKISNTGQKRSKETCEKLKNRVITDKWRANMSKGAKNKIVPNCTKELLLSYASKPKSEETKRKISESLKLRNAKKFELTEPPINV